jgi:hypothetical protein
MIENDGLETAPRSHHLFTDSLKNGADGGDILIARSTWKTLGLSFEAFWKINLARLIIDYNAGHRMVRLLKKKALKRERHGDMIGKPIRTATDFPEII